MAYSKPKIKFGLRFVNGYKLNVNPTFCYLTAYTTIDSMANMVMGMSQENIKRFIKVLNKKIDANNK